MRKTRSKRTRPAKAAGPDPATLPARVPDPAGRVLNWIVRGLSEEQILASIAREWPGAQARPLILAAMKHVAGAAVVDRDTLIGWCLEATRTVYQDALEAGEYGDALRAIRQLHELAAEATDAAPPAPAD